MKESRVQESGKIFILASDYFICVFIFFYLMFLRELRGYLIIFLLCLVFLRELRGYLI